MAVQVQAADIAEGAQLDLVGIVKRAGIAAGVTFLLTIGLVGFETVSSTGQLRLQPRFGAVAFAVAAVFVSYVCFEFLRARRPTVPLIVGAVASAILLIPLLTGDTDWQWVLPFEAETLDWAALLLPLGLVVRALQIATSARARASGRQPPAILGHIGAAFRRLTPLIGAALLGFAIVLPFLPFADRRLIDICTLVLTYIMLGWGLNIVVGLAGLLDLGYVAFYAVGAYSYALLSTSFGLSFWVCLPLA
jgi:branched-chain amino acid transport system permease protein